MFSKYAAARLCALLPKAHRRVHAWALTHTYPHTQAHTCTHTSSLSLSHSHTLTLSHSHTHTHTLTLSHSRIHHPQLRVRPLRLVFYDTKPGGVGVAYAAFEMAGDIVQTALEMVEGCACSMGCPMCIHDFGCLEYNERASKRGALIILQVCAYALPDKANKA